MYNERERRSKGINDEYEGKGIKDEAAQTMYRSNLDILDYSLN